MSPIVEIHFSQLVQFTGRNGTCNCSGLQIYRNDTQGPRIYIDPLTSRGIPGRGGIEIPVDAIPAVIGAFMRLTSAP